MGDEKERGEIMLSDNISGINRVAELFATLCDSTAVEVLQLCHHFVVKSCQVKIRISVYIKAKLTYQHIKFLTLLCQIALIKNCFTATY